MENDMISLLDIIEHSLYETTNRDESKRTDPEIKIKEKEIPSDLHSEAYSFLIREGFVPVTKPHPAINKLLNFYNKHNPTVYESLKPQNCQYCVSTSIETACVFFNPVNNKFCLAYNPKFINEQIDGFDELIKSGIAKNKSDSRFDEDELSAESVQRLNFLIAHEINHIFKGDLRRFSRIIKTPNPTEEMQKIHNIASDSVNNQELLDTSFKLGGPVGYKFIEGGYLTHRKEDLLKKYNINQDRTVFISEISKKNPWDMEENSDTYYTWIMNNIDEYDKHMDEFQENQPEKEEDGDGDGDDDKNKKPQKPTYRVGDPIRIPDLGDDGYGRITKINGDDIIFETISKDEAIKIVKEKGISKPRVGFAMYNAPESFISKMCNILKINVSYPSYKKDLVSRVFTQNNLLGILTSGGIK
jgi:hypothetical protein